jgi:hypothetical protein
MEGRVRIEIVARQDEESGCPDALACVRELQKRVLQLLLGDLKAATTGIKGVDVSKDWNVTRFARSTRPDAAHRGCRLRAPRHHLRLPAQSACLLTSSPR